ncbi:phage tail tube protein [Salinarimonas sp.]|uniref:phage tail tube protein n=1 Tax=Salinarimonas sp. TaxID=2766526 RepID=UPI0039191A49
MARNRIGGVAYIKVDDRQIALRGGLTVSVDGFEREGVAGQDGVHGYTEKPRVPFIECDVTTTAEASMDFLRSIVNATVTAELANGKTYVLRDAWTAGAREINAEEGMVNVRFEGMSGTELS